MGAFFFVCIREAGAGAEFVPAGVYHYAIACMLWGGCLLECGSHICSNAVEGWLEGKGRGCVC